MSQVSEKREFEPTLQCSSVQTHRGPDPALIAGIYVSCGQLSDDSESISELRNKKIRASVAIKLRKWDQFCFKRVQTFCHKRQKFCEKICISCI